MKDEDWVQWRRWRLRQQPSMASKTKARRWRDSREGGSSVGVGVGVGVGVSVGSGGGSGGSGRGGCRW